jgi:hypothetical protein
MDDQQSAEQSYIEPATDPAVPQVTNNPHDRKRLDNLEDLVQAVFIVIVVSVAALVVSVAALVIDQFHYNTEFYRQATGQKSITTTKTVIVKQPLINNTDQR